MAKRRIGCRKIRIAPCEVKREESAVVYALAIAPNGFIKPGDLLTTSEVAGHAMKATDRELWPGAVIGKAMSKLENGEGLLLVLVNLQ